MVGGVWRCYCCSAVLLMRTWVESSNACVHASSSTSAETFATKSVGLAVTAHYTDSSSGQSEWHDCSA